MRTFVKESEEFDQGVILSTLNQISIALLFWALIMIFVFGLAIGTGEIFYSLKSLAQLVEKHQEAVLKITTKDIKNLGIDPEKYFTGILKLSLGIVAFIVEREVRRFRNFLERKKL